MNVLKDFNLSSDLDNWQLYNFLIILIRILHIQFEFIIFLFFFKEIFFQKKKINFSLK